MNKNTVISSLVAAGVLVLALVVWTSRSPAPQPQQAQNQNYGALTSPIIASPVLSWGGVPDYRYTQSFQASSTACAIQNPLNATTTLTFATANITSSPAYAVTYELGESLTKNATTTAIVASWTVASNGVGQVVATTTNTALVDSTVPPNAWINFNLSTSTATGINQATGDCEVGFRKL